MKHLGDICKINGAEIEPVDVIIGGSPCQDLSVAGKRAGLEGTRSGLFTEQIRIIKEMRERDKQSGRTDQHIRPRYMVWENVPGAFSSNKAEDFRAVLEETARIAQPDADIPRPPKKWTTAGAIMGDGWSIAWRVLDAQFWGVPQRRRRIALVADFGGESAPEILFVEQGLPGHSAESGAAGERAAGDAEGGAGAAITDCLTPWDYQGKRVFSSNGVMPSIYAAERSGQQQQAVFCLQGNGIDRADTAGCNGKGWTEDVCYTLNTIDRPAVAYSFDSLASNSMKSKNPHSGCREVEIAKTLDTTDPNPSKNQGGICIVEPVTFSGENATSKYNVQNPQPGDPCHTLDQDSRNYLVQPAVCIGNGQAHIADHLTVDVCQTLNCERVKAQNQKRSYQLAEEPVERLGGI